MLTLEADRELSAEETSRLAGDMLTEDSFDRLVEQDCDAVYADGEALFHFRKTEVPQDYMKAAYPNIRGAATVSDQRGVAGGRVDANKTEPRPWGTDDSDSSDFRFLSSVGYNVANRTMSGTIGYGDRYVRKPYCRTTAYTLQNPERFLRAIPFIQSVSDTFRKTAPVRYAAQHAMIQQTHPDFTIHNTVFTTVTVNRNWQTAVHTDKGDYAEGMGVMAAMWRGKGDGCYLVFPAYRLAVSMRTGDVLMANVHEWHGNTPFKGTPGRYERLSCVFYYRNKMIQCGSAAEELERAKRSGSAKVENAAV